MNTCHVCCSILRENIDRKSDDKKYICDLCKTFLSDELIEDSQSSHKKTTLRLLHTQNERGVNHQVTLRRKNI